MTEGACGGDIAKIGTDTSSLEIPRNLYVSSVGSGQSETPFLDGRGWGYL